MIVIEDDGCEDFHAMDGDVSQGRKESKGGKCSSNAAIVVDPAALSVFLGRLFC